MATKRLAEAVQANAVRETLAPLVQDYVTAELSLRFRVYQASRDVMTREAAVARLVKERDLKVRRVLNGMTSRQRKMVETRPRLSGRTSPHSVGRAAIQRRITWAHRNHRVFEIEAAAEPYIAQARQDVVDAKRVLRESARDALDFWPDDDILEARTGFARKELSLMARKPRGATATP